MPHVGWRLAEEIAWARPERPGPEWWTLLDIAQDARDETRQSMCGQHYLMNRGKCSKATLYRRMKALTDAGLLKLARKSAPGVRAIYEIPPLWITPDQVSATVRPDHVSPMLRPDLIVSSTDGSQNLFERVSKPVRTGLTTAETHAVNSSVTTTPSTSNGSVADPNLEGALLSTGEPSARDTRRMTKAAQQASESRNHRTTPPEGTTQQ